MLKYEIFTDLIVLNTKTAWIDLLYGYPNVETKTTTYRNAIKHKDEDLWAGAVDEKLINACSGMSAEDRLQYYDDSDLKDNQYFLDNNWFDLTEV